MLMLCPLVISVRCLGESQQKNSFSPQPSSCQGVRPSPEAPLNVSPWVPLLEVGSPAHPIVGRQAPGMWPGSQRYLLLIADGILEPKSVLSRRHRRKEESTSDRRKEGPEVCVESW